MEDTSPQGDVPREKERTSTDHHHDQMTEVRVNTQESDNQLRTVEVVSSGALQDELEYRRYFENPEVGGPVETVFVDKEKETVRITFVSAEAAATVCDGQHMIEDQAVAVKLLEPPINSPNYPNKLLFRNVPEDVSKDHLTSFVENLTGCEPAEILYGDDAGAVLASFQLDTDCIDFDKVEEKCRGKKLKGQHLTAERVPVSSCVLVENLARQTDDETIHMFFENSRRSGGGPVQRVARLPPGNTCLVYFQHHQVLDSVLSKTLTLDNHELRTRTYLECLGQSGGRDDPAAFSTPDDLVVADEARSLFLSQKPAYFQLLGQHLSRDHASVSVVHNNIVVKCKLTPTTPNARSLATEWAASARQTLDEFLNKIHVEMIQTDTQHIWPLLEKAIENQLSEQQRSEVSVLLEASTQTIKVVGSHAKVCVVAEKLQNIMKDLDALIQREEEVEETVPVKSYRTGLLQAAAFQDEMAREHPGLTVTIRDGEVSFRGVLEEVKSAQLKMYACLEEEETVSVTGLPAGTVKVLVNQNVKNYICRQFTTKGVTAVMEVRENEVVVFALSKATADRAASIVRDSVTSRVVQLSRESSHLLHTPEFHQTMARLTGTHPGLDVRPSDDRTYVTITATDDVIEDATTQIEDFISKNTIYTTELRLSPTRHRFVVSVWKQRLDEITSSLKDEKVKVTADEDDPKFCASGTGRGLTILIERFRKLEEEILVQEETLESEETLTFLNSDKRDKDLRKLELFHRCAVGFDWETPGIRSTNNRFKNLGSQGTQRWSRGGLEDGQKSSPRMSVTIRPGEIAMQEVDVIVNSTNADLDLEKGAISGSILRAAGQSLQVECRTQYPRGIPAGTMAVTGGHRLRCRQLYHLCLPEWKGKPDEQLLHQTVTDCITRCNQSGFTSIAFPALGTGNLSYPPEVVAQTMVDAVYHIYMDNSLTALREVRLIVYEKDRQTMEAFRQVSSKYPFLTVQEKGGASATIQTPKPDMALSTKPKPARSVKPEPAQPAKPEPAQSAKPETEPRVKPEAAQAPKSSPASRTPPPRPPAPAFRRSATLPDRRGSSRPPQLTVTLVSGEIAQEKVDVMVNSTGRDLALQNGAVSSSILRAAGQSLQDECRTQYPLGIPAGTMAVTGGHSLACQQLYHLCLPQWSGQQSKQVLHTTVLNCLANCSQSGFKSIAIPALGTGNMAYPRHEVAQTMMDAIHQFQQTNPFSGLGEVRIVIYHQDAQTMMEFRKVEQRSLPRRQSLPASVRQVKGKRHRRTFSDLGDLTKVRVTGSASNIGEWHCDVMGVRVTVRRGDITEEDAHAVVNLILAAKKLDRSKDEVSKSLRSKCGMQLEEELKTKREDISQKGLTVTSAPNLRCSMVLHVDGKKFSGKWKSGIRAVLEEAESYRAKSVAIPNLGTSPSKLASDLLKAVTRFYSTEDMRHVEEVRVVLTDWLHVPEFRRALQTEIKKPRKDKRASGFGKRMFQAVKNAIPWRHSSSAAGNKTKATNTYRPGMLQKGTKLYIYGESEEDVQEFLKAFDDHVKDKVTKMVFTDPALKSLSKSEMKTLRDIAEGAEVRLEAWQEVGRYELRGVVDVLPRVQQDLSHFLRAAEHRHRERENQSLIAGMVQWSFLERTKTETTRIEYRPKENKMIETAYVQGQRTAEIVDSEGTVYVIDFDRMVEYPKGRQTAEHTVEVIRKPRESESSVTQLPDTWTPQGSDEPVKLVKLLPSDVEYQQVKQNVMATLGNSTLSIICIDRVQNVMLYQQYQAKKTHMDRQNGPGFQNEMTLWHGTSADAIQNINNHGFNRSFCGKNATAYGKGVYFATESSYSTEHRYSPPDPTGNRFLYQCRVLVGHPTLGASDMRFLPPRSDRVVCDSATNNLQKPDMYVIFNDTQAYPQYLITFK